jgi:hypothetical protein
MVTIPSRELWRDLVRLTMGSMNSIAHPVDPTRLHRQYVSMWNEPDTARRHEIVDELFAPGCTHRLQPPKEVLLEARRIGFANPTLGVRGLAELYFRVDQAHAEFIEPGAYRFEARGAAQIVGDVVKLEWNMVSVETGEPAGGGTEVLVLSDDGRITSDTQFIDP